MSAILRNSRRVLACASFVGLMLLMIFAIQAWSFTYDGDINPNVIDTWERVETSPPDSQGIFLIITRNPDQLSPVKYVVFLLKAISFKDSAVIRYAYYRNDEFFNLVFNDSLERYQRIKATQGFRDAFDNLLKPYLEPKPGPTNKRI